MSTPTFTLLPRLFLNLTASRKSTFTHNWPPTPNGYQKHAQACFASVLTIQLQKGNFESNRKATCALRVHEVSPIYRNKTLHHDGVYVTHPASLLQRSKNPIPRAPPDPSLLTPTTPLLSCLTLGMWVNLTCCSLCSLVRIFSISPPDDKNPTCPQDCTHSTAPTRDVCTC